MPSAPPPAPGENFPRNTTEFVEAIRKNPGFLHTLEASLAAALALPPGPETAEIHDTARALQRQLPGILGLVRANDLIQRCGELLAHPGDLEPPQMLQRLEALTGEAIDHLLDAPEPQRTQTIAIATSLRDNYRRILGEA